MKSFFGALVGVFVGLFLLVLVLIGFAVGAAASGGQPQISLSDQAVVQITLDGTLNEKPNEVDKFWSELLDEPAQMSLYELLQVVDAAGRS